VTQLAGGSRAAAISPTYLALGCVGFLCMPAGAAAQTVPPTELELAQNEIIVTGTANGEDPAKTISSPKATAPILDTARIVNVITEKVLQETGSFSLQDSLRTVPGITLGAGEGGTASGDIPLIRGVDATSDTFVDGARDPGSQTRETFAVERIEVFKGPDSAVGGRGAAGGLINIVSKVAREGNFGSAQATVGTANFKRLTADVNAQVSDGLALRVAGLWHDADVPGRDSVFDKRLGIAPSLTWGLGTSLTATLAYYHLETDGMPDYGLPLTSRGQLPGGVRIPAEVDRDNFYGLLARDFQKTKVDAGTLQLTADLGSGWVISNVSRYSRTHNDYIVTNPDDSAGNVANGLVWRNTKSRNSVNKSFVTNSNVSKTLETGPVRHSLAFGFEAASSDTFNRPYVVATGDRTCPPAELAAFNCTDLDNPDPNDPWVGSITPSTTPGSAKADEYGFYAFDTITIIPQLLVNGGARWTHFKVKAAGLSRGVPFDVSSSSSFWSYQGALILKPIKSASLYLSYANSKNPPGGDVGEGSNAINAASEFYAPQGTENWELGGKAELFGGGLLLSAALFQADRSNIRQTDPTGEVTEILNAARLRGFELGAAGRIGPVSVTAGYTYVDSELRDESADDGNALPNTPKQNLAFTGSVQVTPRFSFGGGAYHESKRYADPANLISADGYWRFDANATYSINEHFGLRLNLQNLTDERYIVKLRNPHFAVPAPGRQALLTFFARY
jgi:catecholate siderophore receptor